MLIIYLAAYKNKDLIKGLTSVDIKNLMHDRLDLTDFIKKDMQQFKHATEVVIERDVCENTDDEFIDLLRQFTYAYDSRLIVYTPDALDKNLSFVKKLVDTGIYDIVTATEYDAVREQFTLALNGGSSIEDWYNIFPELMPKKAVEVKDDTPKPSEDAIRLQQIKDFVLSADNVAISFSGICTRCGTTKLAIDYAQYLTSLGAKVAIIDNSVELLDKLYDAFNCDIVGGNVLKFKDIDFMAEKPSGAGYNIIIYDMSKTDSKYKNNVDLRVLCSTFNVFETNENVEKVEKIKPDFLIGNLVANVERQSIKDKFLNYNMGFAEYSAGYFLEDHINDNSSFFNSLTEFCMNRQNEFTEVLEPAV